MSLNPAASNRRYRALKDDDIEAGVDKKPNFAAAMHDERNTGILSIMNSIFNAQRYEKSGRQAEGFKLAVLQWSSAYGVAYSLMMTIAVGCHRDQDCSVLSADKPICVCLCLQFGMLITRPVPSDQSAHVTWPATVAEWKDFRPHSDVLDTIVPLVYYFFAAAACCDSAWGMLICAEWGVRGSVMPAALYERFIRHLRPDPNNPGVHTHRHACP